MSESSVTPSHKKLEHRIFRSDSKLSPSEINELLGIKTVVPTNHEEKYRVKEQQVLTNLLKISVVTVLLTGSVLIGSMYQMKIGPFYDHEAIASSGVE